MNKSIKMTALLSLLASGLLHATTEFRSPFSVERGPMHWPLRPPTQTWWYEYMPDQVEEESLWNVYSWSSPFYRCADKAYFDPCESKTTRCTTSLSSLWFGKESFRGEEAFTGGIINDPLLLSLNNPYLGFARISPRFDYNEWGVMWGLSADRRFGNKEQWHAGARISMPFKVIEIEQNSNVKLEETLEDVFKSNVITVDANADPNDIDFAARFDLLRSLLIAEHLNPPGNLMPAPLLTDATSLIGADPNELLIGPSRISAPATNTDANLPPVYVTRSNNGEIPATPFRKRPDQVSRALAADGSGGADGATLFLETAAVDGYVSQLFTDREAQGKLFVTPRRQDAVDNTVENARAVFARIQSVLQLLDLEDGTASEFFRKNCIDLNAHERIAALGDIETEAYVGYGQRWEDSGSWFADFVLGARLPTGKKNNDPRRIYFQSTGHNRHYEIKLGLEGGWMPRDWFGFKLDWFYNHAFKRTEKKAAAFKGATVKNIGPTVNAKISWDSFELRADFNFFHPHNPELGWVFGYELFAKRKDKVRFVCDTATDLLGRTDQKLDACILEDRTNAMTHKLRGEVFHRWSYFELFAGGSHVLAGRNAMRESEAHVGVAVYF